MLQLQPVGARTTGPVTKSLDPATDGSAVIHAPSQTPFAHFLHALFATATSKEETAEDHEMPNEIPLIPQQQQQQPQRQTNEDDGVHSFEDTTLMFPRMVYKRAGRPLCGRFLVDALQLACGEGLGYQTLFQPTGKRSDGQNGAQENTWPFINSQKAHQVLSNSDVFHRQTRGVYDECCLKPCTMRELRSYCRSPN